MQRSEQNGAHDGRTGRPSLSSAVIGGMAFLQWGHREPDIEKIFRFCETAAGRPMIVWRRIGITICPTSTCPSSAIAAEPCLTLLPDKPFPLRVPLTCWHESLASARTDRVVALSKRGAWVETSRPVPAGTRLYLDIALGEGVARVEVDAEAVAEPAFPAGFAVRFVELSPEAALLMEAHLDSERRPIARAPGEGGSSTPRDTTPAGPLGAAPPVSDPDVARLLALVDASEELSLDAFSPAMLTSPPDAASSPGPSHAWASDASLAPAHSVIATVEANATHEREARALPSSRSDVALVAPVTRTRLFGAGGGFLGAEDGQDGLRGADLAESTAPSRVSPGPVTAEEIPTGSGEGWSSADIPLPPGASFLDGAFPTPSTHEPAQSDADEATSVLDLGAHEIVADGPRPEDAEAHARGLLASSPAASAALTSSLMDLFLPAAAPQAPAPSSGPLPAPSVGVSLVDGRDAAVAAALPVPPPRLPTNPFAGLPLAGGPSPSSSTTAESSGTQDGIDDPFFSGIPLTARPSAPATTDVAPWRAPSPPTLAGVQPSGPENDDELPLVVGSVQPAAPTSGPASDAPPEPFWQAVDPGRKG